MQGGIQHHRQQRVEALVHNPHAVHELGGPRTVAPIMILESNGAYSTGHRIQHHQCYDNGQLFIILEDHGCWKDDGAHQLA